MPGNCLFSDLLNPTGERDFTTNGTRIA
ncbi:hypothetical protein GWI33_001771, partial [Rhynchophorus ferrugineus]